MATSGNKPLLKRGSEKELGIPRKKLKIDETVLRENQSDKAGGCGRSWKNSYRRYKSKCYGRRKESNSFKTLIGKKRKEEVDIGDDTDKVDAKTIEEIVVRQPSCGSDAFNESFVRFLNEKYGEGGEVSNLEPVENKGEKIVIVNDNDEEIFEVLEAPEEYLVDEEYDVEEDIYEDNDGHEKEMKL